MKAIKSTFLTIFVIFTIQTSSQSKTSEVIYKVKSLQNLETIKDFEAKSYLKEIYEGFDLLEYTLVFNQEESLFEMIKKIKSTQSNNSLLPSLSETMAFSGKVYTRSDSKIILHQKKLSSDTYIIKQNAKDYKWNLTNNSKKIGDYTCFMATLMDTVQTVRGKRPKHITAWYAPTLPFSFGPTQYIGLPGLILELIENDNIVFYADKIVLNKDNSNFKIESPRKGKILTKDEFNEIERSGFRNFSKN
ncbi:MAG: GLPGLI family protein [Flavobacteriaceae bacterium]|nr:GLPGLI family protein [Flavobacteriaceae bacterium]